MADYKKLDTFFASNNPLAKKAKPKQSKHTKVVRWTKLLLPCIAAALLGLLVVFPKLKEAKEISIDITIPKKGELEKLHVENTVLYITDKDNKVHNVTAENIDETEPGSKLIKIIKPEGLFPSAEGKWLNLKSPAGYYKQEENQLTLTDDVAIYYSEGMDVEIPYFTFDFKTSRGFSDAPLKATGFLGNLDSQGIDFYSEKNLIIFKGKTHIAIKEEALKGQN